MKIHKLTLTALLVAIGTLSAHLIYIPAGISKCFPVQHAINVLGAVILGPGYATAVAFVISCLRNMFGTGSLLAFPGSMIGACLAGLCYSRFGSVKAAMAGEIFGTGILGGLTAWVIARFFLNSAAAAWFFIPPFLISTVGGSIIAGLIIKSGIHAFTNFILPERLPFRYFRLTLQRYQLAYSGQSSATAAMRAVCAVYHRGFYSVSLLADYPYRSRRFYLLCDAAVLFYKGLPR